MKTYRNIAITYISNLFSCCKTQQEFFISDSTQEPKIFTVNQRNFFITLIEKTLVVIACNTDDKFQPNYQIVQFYALNPKNIKEASQVAKGIYIEILNNFDEIKSQYFGNEL